MTRRRKPIPDEPRLRLQEPVDVLAAIPYLVGYRPTDSMILLGMRRRRVIFTARIDLPTADSSRAEVRDAADEMLGVLARQDLNGVLIVGFGAEARVAPLAFTLRLACQREGWDVLEVLRAEDGRYWSYLCTDPTCCPDEGSPYDDQASAVAAEWTVAGRVALPDRETYEQQLRPSGEAVRAGVRQATMAAGDRMMALLRGPANEEETEAALLREGAKAIDTGLARLRSGRRLNDEDVAWLSVLAVSDDVRYLAMSRVRTAGDELGLHRVLWMDVLRRAERDLTFAPGCVFAFAAWRCGDGALAKLALEQALEVNPRDYLCLTMHDMLGLGAPPPGFGQSRRSRVKRRSGRRPRRRSSSGRAGSQRG